MQGKYAGKNREGKKHRLNCEKVRLRRSSDFKTSGIENKQNNKPTKRRININKCGGNK